MTIPETLFSPAALLSFVGTESQELSINGCSLLSAIIRNKLFARSVLCLLSSIDLSTRRRTMIEPTQKFKPISVIYPIKLLTAQRKCLQPYQWLGGELLCCM
jgi:hypothetical protein